MTSPQGQLGTNNPLVGTLQAQSIEVVNLTVTGGSSTSTTGQAVLQSSQAAANAVRINASNAVGGIDVDAGTGGVAVDSTGQIALTTTTTGNNSIDLDSANGGVNVRALGGNGFTLAANTKLSSPVSQAGSIVGSVALVAGAATVATTSVTANSLIYLSRTSLGGAAGFLDISAINAGEDFSIASASGTDTSTVAWLIIN